MRIKALFGLFLLSVVGAARAQTAQPTPNVVVEEKKLESVTVVVKEEPKPPAWEFGFHGFIGGMLYIQDSPTGLSGGGQALYAVPSAAGQSTYVTDKPVFSGDVRQTRLNFSMKGPEVMGAIPKGVVEIDFFGAYQVGVGTPATVCTNATCTTTAAVAPAAYNGFGEQSVMPRLRFAYAELAWENVTLWMGQQNHLMFATAPVSDGHIAFPLGYAGGNIGWRSPGFYAFFRFGSADVKSEFAVEIAEATWTFGGWNPGTAQSGGAFNFDAASASGLPMVEARYKLTSKVVQFWLCGHWNNLDLNGPNETVNSSSAASKATQRTVLAGGAGLQFNLGPVTLYGTAWYGKNTGGLLGNLVQFNAVAPAGQPLAGQYTDLFGWGMTGQVGFNFTKDLSLWYLIGSSQLVNWVEAQEYGYARLRNVDNSAMLRYRVGGFSWSFEWVNFFTTNRLNVTETYAVRANQYAINGMYYF
ncbi:MAG TPA: hypothetical protein VMT17_03420 [Anaeromyxobacteraceae bacterium]|nr:hypothetical protein [Anaeromyxobacteraceae bacterium]